MNTKMTDKIKSDNHHNDEEMRVKKRNGSFEIIALRTFYKKLEKPKLEEGFMAMAEIPLILDFKKHDIPEDVFSWRLD